MFHNYVLLITICINMLEGGEKQARWQRVERGELFMYICQIKYVYLSNNCICVTGIHMYIWRARLGEGGEGLEGLGEGGKRRVREDRDQR